MQLKKSLLLWMGTACLFCAACGEQEPDDESDTDSSTQTEADFYPMRVGNFWEYKETEDATTIALSYEVTDLKPVLFEYGGVGEREVYEVLNTFEQSPQEKRIQYIEDDGMRATRLQHRIWDNTGLFTKRRDFVPGFLRFDRSRLEQGATWTEQFDRYTDIEPEDGLPVEHAEVMTYEFEVLREHETITTEAGTFDCMQLQRYTASGGTTELKWYYYARGVGKIREITGGKIEELVSYSIVD